jgi:pimeloyl-ACP methyl ester carboxylesterase
MQHLWPDPSTRLASAELRSAGPFTPPVPPGDPRPAVSIALPEHCEVFGVMHERTGIDGQHYAIRFHLRLPTQWNGRFYFQGGGGTNGVVGDALGGISASSPPALVLGYAVVSQDSGHDNATNSNPARGGTAAFGFDPQARADYGHASLKVVADTAKTVVRTYYGRKPAYAYFVGCSKGGEEGMAFAQRYPEEFNGIVAAAPGFSLPRAAVAEAWEVQSVAAILKSNSTDRISVAQIPGTFSDSDLKLVSDAVLQACDADDGLADGIVGAFAQCSTDKVLPVLKAKACGGDKSAECLSAAQIAALTRIYAGPHDSSGKKLYSDWAWDAGIAGQGWRMWALGSADGRIPALHIALGGSSLAAIFTTPPTEVAADLQASADYELTFDFDRDAPKIYAANSTFKTSAWEDISARSSDLHRFQAAGGKLIVPHGVSDPVFSINDTIAWYNEVQSRSRGDAAKFVRVLPVPGMAHCGGGPSTDQFNAFAGLVDWVEHGKPPDRIIATAGPGSPWPHRTRPLCAYPTVARYKGTGSIEDADNFACQ